MAASRRPGRYISRRDDSFDQVIRETVEKTGYGCEWYWYGVTSPARADEVRRGLRRSGKHLGVAVKAYTADCGGCRLGGPECRFHVKCTVYDMEAARDYMRRKAAALNWSSRG